MHRQNPKRTVTAAIFSLLVASLLLVGPTPVSAQSQSNGQGIPQQIAALEQKVKALSDGLAGLTLGAGPGAGGGKVLRVVDANGTEVGPMISESQVVRQIGAFWVVLSVGPDGFEELSQPSFASEGNCQTLYMPHSPGLVKQAVVFNNTAYYTVGGPKTVTITALYQPFSSGGSACVPTQPFEFAYASEVVKSDLPAFVKPVTVRYDQ